MSAKVRLIDLSARSYDTMVAAARTCYSSGGIVSPETVAAGSKGAAPARKHEGRDRLARSIYQAGHHTTLQHGQAQFALEGVSRLFIWTFLHSHPFYNSEQVSQRYVPVRPENWLMPPLTGPAIDIYRETVSLATSAYKKLAQLLEPAARALYLERFPGRRNDPRMQNDVSKRCLESARYVLPLATTAYLYHTVSVLTLFRYRRLCEQRDAPEESRRVVGAMVDELLKAEPDYAKLLEEPLPLSDTPEARFFLECGEGSAERTGSFREEFDAGLDGRSSRLVAATPGAESLLANGVREVLGLPAADLDDTGALALAMDPSRNRLWAETLNLSTMDRLARPLYHVQFSFRRRLSHTADSQDQRHRMTPASRPSLLSQENGEPDFVTPRLVEIVPEARRFYEESMARIWEGIARFKAAGGSASDALYLLPNAKALRYTESADLLNFRHKAAMRLCYNAQEEIWRLTLEEARQIGESCPVIGRYLLPPCGLRRLAEATPACPEGDRYCGVPVWRLLKEAYERDL